MARAVLLSLAVLTLCALSLAASTNFTANFEVRRPGQNGGFVEGVISYSKDALSIRMDYPARNYSEIQKFNASFGQDPLGNYSQWAYQTGQACSGACRAAVINYAFPQYYLDSFYTASSAQPAYNGCAYYVPSNPSSTPIDHIWFSSTGWVCRAIWEDGADYTFDSNAAATFTNTTFREPDDCVCQGPTDTKGIDVIVLVDRSRSVGMKDYNRAKGLIRDFAKRLDLSSKNVNLLIANYHIDVDLVLEFYQGTSNHNIDAAVNTMKCDCSGDDAGQNPLTEFDEELPDNGDDKNPSCCNRRTSVSRAIKQAVKFFEKGRPKALKIIVLVSDGSYNTNVNGTACTTELECLDDLNPSSLTPKLPTRTLSSLVWVLARSTRSASATFSTTSGLTMRTTMAGGNTAISMRLLPSSELLVAPSRRPSAMPPRAAVSASAVSAFLPPTATPLTIATLTNSMAVAAALSALSSALAIPISALRSIAMLLLAAPLLPSNALPLS